MSALDLVRHLTSAFFVVVAVAVIAQAIRDPRPSRIDTALFFGGLGMLVVQSYAAGVLGVTVPREVGFVSAAALFALPWLELRLVAAHADVDRRVVNGAAIAFVLSTAAIILLPSPPAIIGLFIVGYFFIAGSYAALSLVRQARARSGPTQERVRAGAAGAFLLGLALLAALLRPISADLADVATRLIALASAVAFVAAFTPPRFLRRAWNEPVVHALVDRAGRLLAQLDPSRAAQDVADMARDTMGATDAFVLRSADDAPSSSPLERTAREALIRGEAVAEDTILAAPIALAADRFAAIAVRMDRRPMFVDAALEMLGLVAVQSAVILTASSALEEVRVRNTELEAASGAANEATRAKSEFLAGMSHELRTPLNSILGFSDLLSTQLAATMNERQARYLRNIHEAGAHLLQLINDVLDLARVEARRIELHQENIALDALLAPVRQTAMAEAERRGLHFEAKIEPDLVVNLDPLRARQILLNLVSNAAKFTPKGGTFTLLARAQEDEELVLEVADTGIGIPASRVSRVFGTFERFHEGRYEAEGTGLGLALTKQLVELHGGTIEFETAEGKGTRFTICLPQVVVPLTDDRLLVVDDEPRDAQLIAALATREGFEVEVATSAQSAIAALRRRLPIALVLDLRLPDGRGEIVLDELNRLAARGTVPTIVATVEDDEGASRLNGADDHLTKPLDHARLTGWLRQVAARRAAAAATAKGVVHAAAAR